MVRAIQAQIFPIGSIYLSVLSTNPATFFGGTWARIAEGRALFGVDTGQAGFDTPEETGGAASVTPAGTVSQPTFSGSALAGHSHGAGTLEPSSHAGADVADHPSHTHDVSLSSVEGDPAGAPPTGNFFGNAAVETSGGPSAVLDHTVTQPDDHTMSGSTESVSAGTPAGTVSQPTFTGNAETNLPPYVAVYAWKRTA
jgi:hypothetical protein